MTLTFNAREGMQKVGLEELCDFVKTNIGDSLNIVEIGSYCGASISIIASYFPMSTINCVDPWQQYTEDGSTYDINKQALELAEAELIFDKTITEFPYVIKNKTSSTEYAKNIPVNSLDLVYIDGNHQYSSVKEDILTWLPKIKLSGILAGHDYSWPSVRKAIQDTLNATPNKVFPDSSWVIFKKNIQQ